MGFNWTTASAPRAVVISDRPLEPVLTFTAALLALAAASAVALALLARAGRPHPWMRPARLAHIDSRKDP
jgi:hypothetical protein